MIIQIGPGVALLPLYYGSEPMAGGVGRRKSDSEILLTIDGFGSSPGRCWYVSEEHDHTGKSITKRLPLGTSIVWCFVLLVAALTLIAHFAIQQKARGVAPFSESGSTHPSTENTEHRSP